MTIIDLTKSITYKKRMSEIREDLHSWKKSGGRVKLKSSRSRSSSRG